MNAIQAYSLSEEFEPEPVFAESECSESNLESCLVENESHYRLSNDLRLVPSLVALLQDNLRRMLTLDDADCIRIGVALEEALVNAICHGNLEVSSELRTDDGDYAYFEQIEERRLASPFRDRFVHVGTRANRNEVVCTIRDEGRGFDLASLPDPTDPANLEKPSGRGLLLIRTFMDEVRHNAAGNEITLIKRRKGFHS